MDSPVTPDVSGADERYFFCLPCSRAWGRAAWQEAGWACPSSHLHHSWSEFHPHIGWSHVSGAIGIEVPIEGRRYRYQPPVAAYREAS